MLASNLSLHYLLAFVPVCLSLDFTKRQEARQEKWRPVYSGNMRMYKEVDANHMCDQRQHVQNAFIYCYGTILEAVNYHDIFNDSKDFVDMPMKNSPNYTQEAFDRKFGRNVHPGDIDPKLLEIFIKDHFSEAGSELTNCTPSDWTEFPAKLMTIQDPLMRKWALNLNRIWKTLCKRVLPEIANKIDQYSLIYMPYEFIAPGGRFREFYYWDAYWIIKGLMASQMYETAKRMMRNLALMIDRYGFVPNGGRVYYLRRSQPPLLTAMVYEYYESNHTREKDNNFLKEMLPTLEKEIEFWDTRRNLTVQDPVTGVLYQAYRYYAESNVPRPESFKKDIESSVNMTTQKKLFFYQSVASAAESGWDFSTRWIREGSNLSTIETINIVPVDLNSFMCWNFNILSSLFRTSGNKSRSDHYRERQSAMQDMVESLFYNETTGAWHDFNRRTQAHNTQFYPSIAMPLFTSCYNDFDQSKSERLYELMNDTGVFEFSGGIPTSMIENSGEQWDYPNGWSPLNHIIIEGLRKSSNPRMQEEGYRLAKKWVFGNYRVYKHTNSMWEKYNVEGESKNPGSGGEYKVQDGFGWSNGVILDLLVSYYDRMNWKEHVEVLPEPDEETPSKEPVNSGWLVRTNTWIYVCAAIWTLMSTCL